MSQTTDDVVDEQRTLSEFVTNDPRRCSAIAEYASRRCRQRALLGAEYCADHFPEKND